MVATAKDRLQVETLVRETLSFFNLSHIPLKIRWSNAYTRVMGRAKTNRTKTQFEVSFSDQLWDRATEEQKRNTVIHEVCHIVCFIRHPFAKGHGVEWKQLMLAAGETPSRTIKINRKGVERTNQRTYCYCKCGEKVITSNRATRIRNGTNRYYCLRCGVPVTLVPYLQSKQ